MKSARFALLAIACTLSFAASAQWQWLDKDGRKVFSDQAPPGDVPANRILRSPAGRTAAADAPVANAAAPAPAPVPVVPVLTRPSGKDPALEEKRKQAEAAEAAKKKAELDKFAALRAENCTRARAAKANFDSGNRIAQVNANGEREFLSDEQRAVELRRIEGVIASDCTQ